MHSHAPMAKVFLSALKLVVAIFALLPELVCSTWSVLVLGGTGFRGHPATEYLARLGHNVTEISRGLPNWNTLELLKNLSVTHWTCNRTLAIGADAAPRPQDSGLAGCGPLVNSSKWFDAVVDFSTRTLPELKQSMALLKNRVGIYVFMSSHSVYSVSKNSTHGESELLESDAVRPDRSVSPLDRYALKAKSKTGDAELECEEELQRNFNSGGFPYVAFRLTNDIGPKENTIRYWLLHLWTQAHLALTFPMHLDDTLLETPISLTYTLDIARAVEKVISMARNDTCCPEKVEGEAFNLACDQAPTQRQLYNLVGEPIGLPYIETQEKPHNKSVVLYPEIVRGPVSISKASDVLRWSPTDLSKAIRSIARFYDRTMLDQRKYKRERDLMLLKSKKMLGEDGQRFVEWIRAHYDEKRKTELYDDFEDEDGDELVLVRPDPGKRGSKKKSRRRARSKQKEDL